MHSLEETQLTIGIDFGGTSVKIGVVNQHQIIELAEPIVTQDFSGSELLISEMASSILRLKEKYSNVLAIGGGIPGFIHVERGLVYDLPNVPGWKNVMLADKLTELTEMPCIIDNDANCMAYAEWRHGAGKRADGTRMEHLVCITLGTGVGGGVISGNRMIRGSRCSASEIGQTSINYQGVRGHYGNLGSLEDYIGNNQITRDVQQRYASKGMKRSVDECSPKQLTILADQGDEIALEIWADVAEKLAGTLVNTCWIFNPEAIIIGGGVAKAGRHLFEPLKVCIDRQLAQPFKSHLKIIPACFGNHAGIIGAAAMALELLE